jgi:hypothetical protein
LAGAQQGTQFSLAFRVFHQPFQFHPTHASPRGCPTFGDESGWRKVRRGTSSKGSGLLMNGVRQKRRRGVS